MRLSLSLLVFGLVFAFAPVAAEAKPHYSESSKKSRSLTGQKYSVSKHSKGQRQARRRGGGASASASCLTSEARALLGRIQSRFGHVELVSTCRPGARIATSGRPSRHASGQAIDFRVPGRKREVVSWLIQNHRSGGTMTYSDMDHIHVDVGHHFVALNRPSGH